MALTSGNNFNALVTALVKKDIKPKPTPCFSLNSSLYVFRRSITAFISTSLKVVNIAVSFFTATKRSATFRRNTDIFLCSEPRGPGPLPMAVFASKTSSLVMRPSLPEP